MPQYRQHLSQARASIIVHGPEVLEELVRADYAPKAKDRLEHLREALESAEDVVRDIKAAIATEATMAAIVTEATIVDRERERPAPRNPAEGAARAIDFIMFGTPMFGERR